MSIRWSWPKGKNVLASVLVTVIWNALMIVWLGKTDVRWSGLTMDELFPLLFVGIGIFLAYCCAGALVNRTDLEITPNHLRVTVGPLPWQREVRVARTGITAIIQRENVRNHCDFSTYDVMAVTERGGEKRLLGSLLEPEVAAFFVREIRAFLNLPDRPVSPDA